MIEEPAAPVETLEPVKSDVVREQPTPEEGVKSFVEEWCKRIREAKVHWSNDFKRMTACMKFASGKQWLTDDSTNYVCNIVQRHIQQQVASLYAKNPKAVVRRRKRMDWKLWDGTMKQLEVLQQKMTMTMAGGMPPDPNDLALLKDIADGTSSRLMLDKIAETLEMVYDWIQDNQVPSYKLQLKQLVRRTKITGFGWMKIGYQRLGEKRPEDDERITGVTEQIAVLNSLSADATDGEIEESDAEAEQLRVVAEKLSQPDAIVQEGLVFDFPDTRSIIVDPGVKHLRSLAGAGWYAHEFKLTADVVQEIYNVDLAKGGATTYKPDKEKSDGETPTYCVWRVMDKKTGTTFTVADGYCSYLRPPSAPEIEIDQFWDIVGLSFNELESDGECVSPYPVSDVELLMPMQREYNRSRESLRRHRIANSPKIAVARGSLEDADIDNLTSVDEMGVSILQLNGLQPGQDVKTLLQAVQMPPIDPAKYDNEATFQDVLRAVGTHDANLGGSSGGTATEVSVSEAARTSAMASNIDDLDDFLTQAARISGQILLRNMSAEKAREIAGPGAVWPEMSGQEIADELVLEIEAGSSGRPNKAAEVANLQKVMPFLIQMPGINPEWLAKMVLKLMDSNIDVTDAIAAGVPSIISLNQMRIQAAGAGAAGGPPQQGDAQSNPGAQGAEGAMNSPRPPGRAGTDGGNEAALGGMVA